MTMKLDKLFRPVVSELIWAYDGGLGNFTERIIEQVRQALFDDKLHVGDFLGTENDLARVFGVSRATARSALRELEAVGIIEVKVGAKGGVSVAPLDAGRFINAWAIQQHLAELSETEILQTQRAIEGKFKALSQAVWPDGKPPTQPPDAGAVQAHHRSLLTLIQAGDGPGARQLMLEHLANTHETAQAGGAA